MAVHDAPVAQRDDLCVLSPTPATLPPSQELLKLPFLAQRQWNSSNDGLPARGVEVQVHPTGCFACKVIESEARVWYLSP